MTALTTYLACGCPGSHSLDCWLGLAEIIANEAHDSATGHGRNGLIAAFTALAEAGLLRDITDADTEDLLEGILDMLWDVGLIRQDGAS